jgi:hypothetical protein
MRNKVKEDLEETKCYSFLPIEQQLYHYFQEERLRHVKRKMNEMKESHT